MYKCVICDRDYGNIKNLNRHIGRCHTPSYKPPSPRKCIYCGKWLANLHQHFKRKHSNNQFHKEEVARNKKKAQIYYQNNSETIKKTSLDWYYGVYKSDSKTCIKIDHKEIQLSFD